MEKVLGNVADVVSGDETAEETADEVAIPAAELVDATGITVAVLRTTTSLALEEADEADPEEAEAPPGPATLVVRSPLST